MLRLVESPFPAIPVMQRAREEIEISGVVVVQDAQLSSDAMLDRDSQLDRQARSGGALRSQLARSFSRETGR